MRCPRCSRENPDDAGLCVECGTAFSGRCGADNPPRSKFCAQYGKLLAADQSDERRQTAPRRDSDGASLNPETGPRLIETPASIVQDLVDGERKTVTALFADIKGSTELMADLDPEQARAIIDPALRLNRALGRLM